MKILTTNEIKAWEDYTAENSSFTQLSLMEDAAKVFVDWFQSNHPERDRPIYYFCGSGNNGGDGFAIARLLDNAKYHGKAFCCGDLYKKTDECITNRKKLAFGDRIHIVQQNSNVDLPNIPKDAIVIDALFGIGLNRSVDGYFEDLIHHINEKAKFIISIDIPSGLFPDQHTNSTAIEASLCFSFQCPKLAFMFPENHKKVGEWIVKSIDLNSKFIKKGDFKNNLITKKSIKKILNKKKKFDHKGSNGHANLIVGSFGKVGAAILATKGCLRVGTGLVTTHIPKCAYSILQNSVPEAMVTVDEMDHFITSPIANDNYKAIGVGCGLDQNQKTVDAVRTLLTLDTPLVIDADALNIIAKEKVQDLVPENSILTPHPKEFVRLFGESENDFQRFELQVEMAKKYKVVIVLKGAHTCIACPDGSTYFNNTGNPGMATGGTGDVLTGMITGFLAQGYSPHNAAILGVYFHGLSADIAVKNEQSYASFIASDTIKYLGHAFKSIEQ